MAIICAVELRLYTMKLYILRNSFRCVKLISLLFPILYCGFSKKVSKIILKKQLTLVWLLQVVYNGNVDLINESKIKNIERRQGRGLCRANRWRILLLLFRILRWASFRNFISSKQRALICDASARNNSEKLCCVHLRPSVQGIN